MQRRNAYQELMLDTMTELANTTKTDPVVTRQIREIFEFEKLLAEVIRTRYSLSILVGGLFKSRLSCMIDGPRLFFKVHDFKRQGMAISIKTTCLKRSLDAE